RGSRGAPDAAGQEPAELSLPVEPTPGSTGAPVRSAWTAGGGRPHTSLAHTHLADHRELHGERIRESERGAKEKRPKRKTPFVFAQGRLAGAPGAPSPHHPFAVACYCCGWSGAGAGVNWFAGRGATCGMFGVCVTCPRSASAI